MSAEVLLMPSALTCLLLLLLLLLLELTEFAWQRHLAAAAVEIA
jgi:hypothetical protein